MTSTAPRGWYPTSPGDETRKRWWDGTSWTDHHTVWDPATSAWLPDDAPSTLPPPAQHAERVSDRVLLEINAVGKGAANAYIRVTTSTLTVSASGGVSTWKSLLGVASLGITTVATGLSSVKGGALEIPMKVVDTAFVANQRLPWAELKIIVAGEAAPFHMNVAAAQLAARAINAAVAGEPTAAFYADAWSASRTPRAEKPRQRHKRLTQALHTGQITQDAYDQAMGAAGLEDVMRLHG